MDITKAKESLKTIGIFFLICFYAVGAIGGFGTAVYHKSYFIGVCVIALAGLAFPTVKTLFKQMINGK